MFTGLVETIGQVKSCLSFDGGKTLRIHTSEGFASKISESIAINGVCFTVTKQINNNEFEVFASPNTLLKTNFNILRTGQPVNIERALKLSDRIGGHLVQGHIEEVGKVIAKKVSADMTFFTIKVAPEISKYIVKNGNITVEGVSLTVIDAKNNNFEIGLIPFTLKNTTLGNLHTGSLVNIETDILGKYLKNEK
ncbi:MAG: riboflavin synthase [bacterium]|nr:riboflavin synthase [bacterium]